MAFLNPVGAGEVTRRCGSTGATLVPKHAPVSRVTWAVDLRVAGAPSEGLGRVELDWEQRRRPDGRPIVGEVCWQAAGVPGFLAVDVAAEWMELEPEVGDAKGMLELTITVRGPRPISEGVAAPAPDDADEG